jgi:hypothetical protein
MKSIALGSIIVAMAATTALANAQAGSSMFRLVLANGATGSLFQMDSFEMSFGARAVALTGDSNPVFLQYASAMFNPKEYSISRGASVIAMDASGSPR